MTREQAIEVLKHTMWKAPNEVTADKILQATGMAIKALSQEPTFDDECQKDMDEAWEQIQKKRKRIPVTLDLTPCDDAISREAVLKLIHHKPEYGDMIYAFDVEQLPSVTQKSGKWIPVSERLPEDLEPVNITWVNHNPERYYEEFKDKPFTATGHYCKGRWYWYSCTCQDYLEEYGRCDFDEIDTDIEVIAWMPLPKPYEPQESEDKE